MDSLSLREMSVLPSIRGMDCAKMDETYSLIITCASAALALPIPGQPPRQQSSDRSSMPGVEAAGENSPSNRPARLTCAVELLDSASVIGCMRILPIRPAPL